MIGLFFLFGVPFGVQTDAQNPEWRITRYEPDPFTDESFREAVRRSADGWLDLRVVCDDRGAIGALLTLDVYGGRFVDGEVDVRLDGLDSEVMQWMAVQPQTLRGEHRPLRRVAEALGEDAFLFMPVSFVRRLIEHRTLLVRVGRTWRYGAEGLTDQFDVRGLSAALNRLSCQTPTDDPLGIPLAGRRGGWRAVAPVVLLLAVLAGLVAIVGGCLRLALNR